MDLMSALCSDDYNQPNNRSASLKLKSRTQSTEQMAANAESLQNHRSSDYFNCCDKKLRARQRLRRSMCREGVLVFSVIVLINIASINCIATRHVEGEFHKLSLQTFLSNLPWLLIFMTAKFDLVYEFCCSRLRCWKKNFREIETYLRWSRIYGFTLHSKTVCVDEKNILEIASLNGS